MKTSEAIKIFGNKYKIAKALKITRQAVSDWGKVVPPLRVYQIKEIMEKAKNG
jgi:predicted transcriptional regulator